MESPIIERIEYLIDLCNQALATRGNTRNADDQVEYRIHNKYRSATLSFLKQYFGENHPYYQQFQSNHSAYGPTVESSLGVLQAALDEVKNGWHRSVRGLVSAELFSDFLEMATHLLDEGYKDAAAVMLGSILEEHIRQLCRDNGIDVEFEKNEKMIPKKADNLNSELAKAEVYTKLDQKSVTAWLDLRNKAAHGEYGKYTIDQVKLFSQAVTDFMARTKK